MGNKRAPHWKATSKKNKIKAQSQTNNNCGLEATNGDATWKWHLFQEYLIKDNACCDLCGGQEIVL